MTRSELIARLEQASGPDREMDVEITLSIDRETWLRCDRSGAPIPYLTRSLDAALALTVQKLDDGAIDIEVAHRSVGGHAYGRAEICGPRHDVAASGATPAIALLIALLKALERKDGE